MAWREFRRGKKNKSDIQKFELNLEDNIFEIHEQLKLRQYRHSDYTPFYITDPKLRHIHKATVADRLIHHAVFRIIYPIFDRSFIFDSYSCRLDKGTHRGVKRLAVFARKLSQNYTRPIFGLKCDISRFFDSVDQETLFKLIAQKITDPEALSLIKNIIYSFEKTKGQGIPLGNVTSQLFANIYLNELDRFVKRKLKVKFYLRYCDDFIILSRDRKYLKQLIPEILDFLGSELKLNLHPKKVILRKFSQGFDFLGYVVLPYHVVLRTRTKRRMFRKINETNEQSYLGMLAHCNSYKIRLDLERLAKLNRVDERKN